MLIADALHAWRIVFSPAMRPVLWRVAGLTLLLVGLIWLALTRLTAWLLGGVPALQTHPYLDGMAFFLAGGGLFIGLIYLLPSVAALVAGFFLDDIAAIAERQVAPGAAEGQPLSVVTSLKQGIRFAGLLILANTAALLFVFVPVLNVIAFFTANAYLFGREYFELAAARYLPLADAASLRARHRLGVLSAGALVAGLVAVPVLNLLTPVFGVALMACVYRRLGPPATV